jgi:hypothetical protein
MKAKDKNLYLAIMAANLSVWDIAFLVEASKASVCRWLHRDFNPTSERITLSFRMPPIQRCYRHNHGLRLDQAAHDWLSVCRRQIPNQSNGENLGAELRGLADRLNIIGYKAAAKIVEGVAAMIGGGCY